MPKPKPIPDGYESAMPYLCCKDAARAIEFYQKAFGATESARFVMPGGKIGHAEIKIGKALVMLAEEFPEMGMRGPLALGGTPVRMMIYVEDVDALANRATAAGAKIVQPPTDKFYGDRNCVLTDPFGHVWMFGTRKEEVPIEEQKKRAEALFGQKK